MELRERFMAKVLRIPFTDCWMWSAASEKSGYGRIGMGSRTERAHRASWLLHKGDIPAGMMVCHDCDNRLCVNPDHLFLGTGFDNMHDAAMKGRIKLPARSYMSDERHQPAKLTNDQVRMIRQSDVPANRLARQLGVSHGCVWQARVGRTFKDIV